VLFSGEQIDLLGNLDMHDHRVMKLGAPADPADAATKKYVDDTSQTNVTAINYPDHLCYMKNKDFACQQGYTFRQVVVQFQIGFNQAVNPSVTPNSGANLPQISASEFGGVNAQHGLSMVFGYCCR